MDYPNGFDIKSFPAGKTVALSRTFAIWISIAFFLIVAMCGALLLGIHFKKNYPFLISVDPFTEEWSVITYPGKSEKESVHQYQIVQEKLVSDFVKNWFTISGDAQTNEARWQRCDIEECAQSVQINPDNLECAISCKSETAVFDDFAENVIPNYRVRIDQAKEKWPVQAKGLLINPAIVSESASKWQVYATINSSVMQSFDVLIFVDIERDINLYPATFGYYIKQFNSYRMAK